jgi:hypothetical protein
MLGTPKVMEKKSPNKPPRNLTYLELCPPFKVADFKFRLQPSYESAGALSSRRIIETSSYQTTPCHSPPPDKLSCPTQSLGIEIPFVAGEILLGLPKEKEQRNSANNSKHSAQAGHGYNNRTDNFKDNHNCDLSATGKPLQESDLFDETVPQPRGEQLAQSVTGAITPTKASAGDTKP